MEEKNNPERKHDFGEIFVLRKKKWFWRENTSDKEKCEKDSGQKLNCWKNEEIKSFVEEKLFWGKTDFEDEINNFKQEKQETEEKMDKYLGQQLYWGKKGGKFESFVVKKWSWGKTLILWKDWFWREKIW